MAVATDYRLTMHEDATASADVAWRPGPVHGPFHGAWLPAVDGDRLLSVIDRVVDPTHLRILRDALGWYLVLTSGEMRDPITPWPLQRMGSGPFVFHPADVTPRLPISDGLIARAVGGAHVVGRVAAGRVEWSTWKFEDSFSPGDMLRLPIRTEVAVPRVAKSPSEGYASFPTFESAELPRHSQFEFDERNLLQRIADPDRSFWSRLAFWRKSATAIDWEKGLKPGSWLWSVTPGFLKRLFDRQGAVFDRLAKLFEQGNLDVALKHSIPIDNSLVTSFKKLGWLSMAWQLPTNILDYAFGRLSQPGVGAVIPMGNDRLERLRDLYRKSAERLSAEGRFRRAAYVYAHLLQDYGRAAVELEKGGYHLEAATLLKEKLGQALLAAEVLEHGGYIPEAVKLYCDQRAFESAMEVCDRAGMREEAERCADLWLTDLRKRQQLIEAGDVLVDRYRDFRLARQLYWTELGTKGGRRGEAGSRLVGLDELEGERSLPSWDASDAILRAELQQASGFLESMKELIGFHRAVRQWASGRGLLEGTIRSLHRRTRMSLMEAVRESQRRRKEDARGEAVALLTQHLAEGQDPLVIEDVRRNLATGVGESPDGGRAWKRRSGGIIDLSGHYLCWVRDSWALMDGSGAIVTPLKRLPSLAVSIAKRPFNVKDVLDSYKFGLVAHDHRVFVLTLNGESLEIVASAGLPGAMTVAHGPDDGFVVSTSHGVIHRTIEIADRKLAFRHAFGDAGLESVGYMAWVNDMLLVWGNVPRVDGLVIEDGTVTVSGIESSVGAIERLIGSSRFAFGLSATLEFGLLRLHESERFERVSSDVSPTGITSLASLERPNTPSDDVAIGYEDGRVVIAELAATSAPKLTARHTFRTSLGPIVALHPLPFNRLAAIDLDFNRAIFDVNSLKLEYQGSWERGRIE